MFCAGITRYDRSCYSFYSQTAEDGDTVPFSSKFYISIRIGKMSRQPLSIPQSVTNNFGELCFIERSDANNSKIYLPGMIVGPYDIPHERLRSMCYTHYSNVRDFFLIHLFIILLILIVVQHSAAG